eukprot:gene8252-10140_t
MKINLFLILFSLLGTTIVFGDWTTDENRSIVERANRVRGDVQPSAVSPGLQNLVWDNTLYQNARDLAAMCGAHVSSINGGSGLYGEDLLYFSGDPSPADLIEELSLTKNNYNYDDLQCYGNPDCSPYTNLIWNTTTQIGCSKSNCNGTWYVVCNYYPYGTYSGIAPYVANNHSSDAKMNTINEPNRINLYDNLEARDRLSTVQIQKSGSFDWRDKDIVTYPKDSIDCSAAWAFVAVGIFESRVAMRTEKRPDYSEQQVIDCFANGDPNRCSTQGANLNRALFYIRDNGLMREQDYPYVGATSNGCRFNQSLAGVIGGDVEYTETGSNRDSLVRYNRQQGPIGVGFIAYSDVYDYRSGILTCDMSTLQNQTINHNVLLIGYNQEQNYYIIKNSWGRDWGENGFARVSADPNFDCGISRNPGWSIQI